MATALARYDLPVPGGPYNKIPRQGLRLPVNNWGKRMGRITDSSKADFAPSKPATWSQWTFGLTFMIVPYKLFRIRCLSSSSYLAFLLAEAVFCAVAPEPPLPPLPLRPVPSYLLLLSIYYFNWAARLRIWCAFSSIACFLAGILPSYFSALLNT